MKKAGAFTLVELLVVIAIIALLMSILMPALQRVKKQAKDVLCQSNLHQWGSVLLMYTDDNEGYMPGYDQEPEHWWPLALLAYYGEQDLCLCPGATKFWSRGGAADSPYSAWGIWDASHIPMLHDAMVDGYDGLYGSYGMNEWVGNVADEEAQEFWRRMDVKGAGNVPMLLGCNFMGGFPDHTDGPPAYNGEWNIVDEQMTRYCLDRHSMAINGVFLDVSVRRIDLKELWVLKWHRDFATNGPWTKAGGATRDDWLDTAPWLATATEY